MWGALAALALCSVFGGLLALGQAVAVHHRAGAAADLAALAAADRALYGEVRACATARRVALAQDARVARCAVRGQVADLDVRTRWGPLSARARSRAGPALFAGAGPGPGSGPGAEDSSATEGRADGGES